MVLVFLDGMVVSFRPFDSFVKEVPDEVGAMMLLDDVYDLRTEPVFSGLFYPVLHMCNKDKRAHAGLKFIVRVRAAKLVLDEIARFGRLVHFPNIVIVGPDSRQEGICSDLLCRGLGDIAHHDGVVVGPWRFHGHLLQEGMIEICQLQQPDVGGIA